MSLRAWLVIVAETLPGGGKGALGIPASLNCFAVQQSVVPKKQNSS